MRMTILQTDKLTVANRLTLTDAGSHLKLDLRPGQTLWHNLTTKELIVAVNPELFDSIPEDWVKIDGIPHIPLTIMEAICDKQETP